MVMISLASAFAHEPVNHDEVILGLRTGHNTAFGSFAAASIQTVQHFDRINLLGGIQYNSIGKTAVEMRPAYVKETDWGLLTGEALFAFTNLASTDCFTAGAGVGISREGIKVKLGYYYRIYGNNGSRINEPFNIYYELRANLLPMLESWNLQLVITNNEIFELERHYQPSFIVEGRHDLTDCLGLSMGIGCKPAGMFNLSADYYQSFMNLGIYYRW